MEETTYDVFARKNRGEPLHHVGYLNALDDELARIYAWKTYDEESWFEMCVIRRANIIPVNRQTGSPGQARRPRAVEAIPRIPGAQPYGGES
jgi:1,2-phenylacetyl-CoA epoxidase PaaB subunit